jgi:hypothetical protein
MKGRKPIPEFKDFKVAKKKVVKEPLLKPKENSSFLDLRENISDMIDNMSVCLDDSLIFENPTFDQEYTPEEILSEEVIITEEPVETVEETKEFYPDVFDGLEEEHARISTYLKSMRKNEDFSKENDLVDIPERDVNSYLTTLDKLSNINEQQTDFLEKNKEFVTFDEMKDHYRLFARNVQIQLSSLGGGGVGASDVLQMINENGGLDSANAITLINDTVTAPYINNLVNILDSANVQSIITSDGLLSTSGGVMTGDIDLGSNFITGMVNPTLPSQAVNKRYVDQRPPGLEFEYMDGGSNILATTGKFQYYDSSALNVIKMSNSADLVQWNSTNTGTMFPDATFTIYYQFGNGSWTIKRQGVVTRLDYFTGECRTYVGEYIAGDDFVVGNKYSLTIGGIF